MEKETFFPASSLEEVLKRGQDSDFPAANTKKSYYDRFHDFDCKLAEYPVEVGAMKVEMDQWVGDLSTRLSEVAKMDSELERIKTSEKLINEYSVLFLNKHGPEHIKNVQNKALQILKCFTDALPSYYEVFFLLCSISAHDVGNTFGRTNHEKKIPSIIKVASNNIIDDSIEQRIISRIAGVHGGSISGDKDTISFLKASDTINNIKVREQMLAAILRFADELADDSTRANNPALENGILGAKSEIFHVYSSKLHTVTFQQNPLTLAWEVVLRYEFDEATAKKQYSKGENKKYLLDEIYDRTIKMEQERRYCMRFLRPYCSIEGVNVEITIENEDNVFVQETIKYTLRENGYPASPYNSIKDVDGSILTGAEMAEKLSKVVLSEDKEQ